MGLRDLRSSGVKLCFIVLLTILSVTAPLVQAESDYRIPTFGVSWATRSIEVSVPSEPAIAYDLVVKAIAIWNEAQLWFRLSYFPTGNVYTIIVGKEKPAVLVDFTDYWTVSNYCPSLPLGVEGCTDVRWDVSGNITHAIVFLDTNGLTQQGQRNDPIFLALHEVGHALGLPDLPWSSSIPCPVEDLLCLYYADKYPSTLDLYALHELAEGKRNPTIFLPPTISYTYYMPPMSTDQMTNGPVLTTSTAPKVPQTSLITNEAPNTQAACVLALVILLGTAALLLMAEKRQRDVRR